MTTAWMPGAIRKEIPKHNRRTATVRNRLNLHVAASEASSLYGFFSGAGVCSHFYVRKDGTIEQYVGIDKYSGSDLEGNDATISVETQGGVRDAQGEEWTGATLRALASIFVFVRQQYPEIPERMATSSKIGESSKGLSWHRLGIDGNFPELPSIKAGRIQRGGGMHYSHSRGKICPGDAKIEQIHKILALVQGEAPSPVVVPVEDKPTGNGGGVKNWLAVGDSGTKVKALQKSLRDLGYSLGPDGVDGRYGTRTKNAVRSFQAQAGIVIDGVAGEDTFAALAKPDAPRAPKKVTVKKAAVASLRTGSEGAGVKEVQRVLKTRYPLYASKLVVDGIFGPATDAAVREFQRRSGLAVDGIVGPATRKALKI